MKTKVETVAEGSTDMEEQGSTDMEEFLASIDVSLLDEVLAEMEEEVEVVKEVEANDVVEVEELGGGAPPASCSSSACTSALHTVVVPITSNQPVMVGWGARKVDGMDIKNHMKNIKNTRGIRKTTNTKKTINVKKVISSEKAMFNKNICHINDLDAMSTKQIKSAKEAGPRVVERSLEELQQQAAAISSSYLRERGEVEERISPSSPSHLGGGEGVVCHSSLQGEAGWLCAECGELLA